MKNNLKSNAIEESKSNSFIVLILLVLYLGIDFLPKGNSIDVAGLQWLGLTILNLVVGIYIYFDKKNYTYLKFFNLNKITFFYCLFVFLSALSITYATNKVEGIFTLFKLLTAFISFLLLSVLSRNPKSILLNFSIAVSIILFFQSFNIITTYYGSVQKLNSDELNQILGANTGNMNIFASAILLKIPFVIYCFFHFTNAKKYFFLATLFLSSLVLFLTTSRTNILSLTVYCLLLLSFLWVLKSLKINLKNIVLLFGVFILSFGITKVKSQSNSNSIIQNNVVEKTSSETTNLNAYSGNRFTLWENTIELIKQKPLTGFGLGSYKIEVIPFESKQRDYWAISGHSHNDFLEIASETGIINALIYLGIFILCFSTSLKHIFDKEHDEEQKWIAFIVLLSIIAFGIDSMLNFPIDRPITQIHFVLIFFWLFTITNQNNKLKTVNSNLILIPSIILSLFLLTPSYNYLKSLQLQNTILADEGKNKLSFAAVNALPDFPNLTEYAYPTKALKAKYLSNENKDAEALKLLNESLNDNRNFKYNENLIANIYSKQKNNDSLVKYRKQCFEMFPLYKIFYTNYLVALRNKKDTISIKNAINYAKNYNCTDEFIKMNDDLLMSLKGKSIIDKNNSKTSNDKTLIKNPESLSNDVKLEIIKLTNEINSLKPEDWSNRLRISLRLNTLIPNNPIHLMNIGMSYFKLNKVDQAIPFLEKTVNSNYFNNGLPEFVLGTSYIIKNQKDKGCNFIQKAKAKGYAIPQNIENNCQ
jgi:O-antigen ligase